MSVQDPFHKAGHIATYTSFILDNEIIGCSCCSTEAGLTVEGELLTSFSIFIGPQIIAVRLATVSGNSSH